LKFLKFFIILNPDDKFGLNFFMTSKEIRKKYLEFFRLKNHEIIPSASLLPENDSSTLFTGSGMQPLVPYLLGEKHPAGKRLCDSQKCFRAEDIDEVGDNRHNTFFEMLGNWSLGDYFKEEQLAWLFEFLTGELKLDSKRLYVTVFRGNPKIGITKDEKSVEIWKKLFAEKGIEAKDVDLAEANGMENGRIFYYDERKNWWSRSGIPEKMPVGEPGGPDSEIFYDLGADLKSHENSPWRNLPCHVNCDCGRFIEIGNSVFMEFIKTEKGFEPLPQKNVDFGGGLERMTMVAQGKDNVFETDLFASILNKINVLSGKQYRDNKKSFEIIADHLKAAVFIMGDDKGISPSNVGAGYVVRRLLRRSIRHGRLLGITEESWLKEIAKILVHDYQEVYPELGRNADAVIDRIKNEEEKFAAALEKGLKQFNELIAGNIGGRLDGVSLFDLYQSFGFPLEMSLEIAAEREIETEDGALNRFNELLEEHRRLSQTASAGMFKGGLADASEETTRFHTAAHLLLAALRKVLGDHVLQKGSNITAERLRFDFSHPEKMTKDQIKEVENLVNEAVKGELPVSCEEMTIGEARQKGAMGVFDSKYGDKVKVYRIGGENQPFSYEICGGPHAENTAKLGRFRIIKEESSSAGVRRIKAVLEGGGSENLQS